MQANAEAHRFRCSNEHLLSLWVVRAFVLLATKWALKNLRKTLEKLYDNSIKILSDLIGFKTISGDDNSELINYCEEYLNKLGASSFKTFDEGKKRVNLFATIKAKKPNGIKPIILSGHTDTVPVSKSWSTDPFKATIKGDKLYGRGSCDMKGFIACALAFAPIFSKIELNRDIHFSFTFDEETAC